ncbi:MAG: 30S ribosomal protein S7, partial [Actinobacteria bacterium]|nr:30S ribosomal protein S7 [Actinomycetota bacterium]
MARRGRAPKRSIIPDPIYKSRLVTQLINKVLSRGKKGVAEKIVYKSLEILRERTKE